MSRDGSGNYTIPNTFTAGTTIVSDDVDANFSDIATALTASIAKDGQTTPTANLPMGNFRHTGVGAAAALTDYARAGEVQASGYIWATVGGTVDVITLSTTFAPAAYAAGHTLRFKASGANTTAVTINWNSLGAKSLKTAAGSALAAGDIASGDIIECTYDGTDFRLHKAIVVDPGLDIDGLTAETSPAVADTMPIYDASATANRKITLENLIKIITALTAETAPATGDELAIYDVSATASRKMTLANALKVVASLTALTAPATDDSLLIYDLSATDVRSISVVDLLEALNVLTEDTSPDGAADFVLTYDASASTVKKVKPNNLVQQGGITTIASGSLSGSAVAITNIPATYAYLVLQITGASTSSNANIRVRPSVDNGSSYDTTAGNYVGFELSGTAITANAGATMLSDTSLVDAATTLAATICIYGYQAGPHKKFSSRFKTADTSIAETENIGTYIGSTSAIDALQISCSAGTFDAGTYALYGIA